MNAATRRSLIDGPAGALECAIDEPASAPLGVAVLCHPHPQFGGTLDNKVVQTLARGFVQLGWRTVRFNFRGIGASAGTWDEGHGEVDDAMAVALAHQAPGVPLAVAGFSFGGYVASHLAQRLALAGTPAARLVLVAPAVVNFSMAAVPADTVIIQGESDDVVPLQAVLDWARKTPLPVTVLPGSGHFFHGQLTLLKAAITAACR